MKNICFSEQDNTYTFLALTGWLLRLSSPTLHLQGLLKNYQHGTLAGWIKNQNQNTSPQIIISVIQRPSLNPIEMGKNRPNCLAKESWIFFVQAIWKLACYLSSTSWFLQLHSRNSNIYLHGQNGSVLTTKC